jgi:hypothetical protein
LVGTSKFGVVAPYLAAAGIVGLAFGSGSIPHQNIISESFLLFLKINTELVIL